MKIGRFTIVRGVTIKKFYWRPKRLTLKCNPAIYRWGYWNFDFLSEEERRG